MLPPAEDATSAVYTRMGGGASSISPKSRRFITFLGVVGLCAAALTILALSSNANMDNEFMIDFRSRPAVPHTDEWCTGSGAKVYSKSTLKRVVDRPISGLLTYSAVAGEKKFEASDVIRVDEDFYVVCDSSWSILKFSDKLPLLSAEHRVIRHDESFAPPEKEDSGFEAICENICAWLSHRPAAKMPCARVTPHSYVPRLSLASRSPLAPTSARRLERGRQGLLCNSRVGRAQEFESGGGQGAGV